MDVACAAPVRRRPARGRSAAAAAIELSEEGPKDDAKPSEHLTGASGEMG